MDVSNNVLLWQNRKAARSKFNMNRFHCKIAANVVISKPQLKKKKMVTLKFFGVFFLLSVLKLLSLFELAAWRLLIRLR